MREGDSRRIGCCIPAYVRRNTVELIKAVRGRQTLGRTTKVPFAENRGGVADTLEQFTHREGVGGKCIRTTLNGDQRQTVADRVLPSQKGRTGGGAGWFH